MASTIQRLTMYALLSSLEGDLRDIISGLLPIADGKPIPDDMRKRATERFSKENPVAQASDVDLVEYLDLGDEIQLVRIFDGFLDEATKLYLKPRYVTLEALISIRNRVMHSRPLEFDDYFRVADVTMELIKSHNALWANLRTIIRHLDNNPDYVAGITIPVTGGPGGEILNNLPQVEFDDTGFLGRQKELSELRRAILGSYPVVTVVGEGGLGKTALTLKACYDFLDETKFPFDAIVWTTAKATKLTPHEIEVIEGAITSSLGLLESAAAVLGRQSSSAIDDLLLHMENNRILLVIDNLETVVDNTLRELARRLPSGSKLLLTTRIGLGAFDFPIPIGPLSLRDSSVYFRSTTRAWGVRDLSTASNQIVEGYCAKLQHNPLFIKWFVQSVRAGKRPSSLTTDPSILLKFCLQNVFNSLGADAKRVAGVLAGLGGSQTIAGLCFFTGLDSISIQGALTVLLTSNLVSAERGRGSEEEDRYVLSTLARMYIQRFIKPIVEEQRLLIAKQKELRSAQESFSSRSGRDVFDINTVFIREKDDYIVAIMLTSAISNVFAGRHDSAEAHLRRALDLSPNYFEVHRVRAFLAVEQGDAFEAEACYETAISLAAERAPLRVWFAGFLTRILGDHERALEQLVIAERLAPGSPLVKIECARVLLYQRKFDEAREYLDQVAQMNDLSAKTRRVHLDLCLQNDVRRAETHVSVGEEGLGFERLQDVRRRYETSSSALIDARTIRSVQKAARCLPALKRAYKGLEHFEEVCRFETWLSDLHPVYEARQAQAPRVAPQPVSDPVLVVGEQGEGRLAKLHKGYGFAYYKGARLFFASAAWKCPIDFRLLGEGTPVRIVVGKGARGWIANDVRPLDTIDDNQVASRSYSGRVARLNDHSGQLEIDNGMSFDFHPTELRSGVDFKSLALHSAVEFGVYKGGAGRWRAKNIRLKA